MKIVVFSCDKNEDIFEPFKHCLEKYYKNHPEVIYITETIKNPFYKTICKNYPLEHWTCKIREALEEIEDDIILVMIDDDFIRNKVDTKRIDYLSKQFKENMAVINFEKSYDINDEDTDIIGVKKRQHGAPYEVSINCGLYDRKKLIDILSRDSNPWDVELNQDNRGYDYYINAGDYIIDWGYVTWCPSGLFKGKWCKEIIPFFEKEEIKVDYEKRGFYD